MVLMHKLEEKINVKRLIKYLNLDLINLIQITINNI